MGFYDRQISPRIVSYVCGLKVAQRQRRKVVPRARGRVLEIGMGSGHNLAFYDPEKVEMVWGLEPNKTMRGLAEPKTRIVPFEVRLLDRPGEEIPLEDNSVDTVLTTFTLCSIADLAAALEQMRRVLKPGGELLFLEHGEAPDENIRRWQRRIEPGWKKLFGGCHLTRAIPRLIESAGFAIRDLEAEYAPGVPRMAKIAAFEYCGAAEIG